MHSYPADKRNVEIKNLHSRHPSILYEISGRTEDVILAVAEKLASDTHTPMYDHMKLSVVNIDTSQQGRLTIRLYKSLYAGD